MRVGEAARALGVGPSTIRRWLDRGAIAGRRSPGGQRWVSREAVCQLLGAEDREEEASG